MVPRKAGTMSTTLDCHKTNHILHKSNNSDKYRKVPWKCRSQTKYPQLRTAPMSDYYWKQKGLSTTDSAEGYKVWPILLHKHSHHFERCSANTACRPRKRAQFLFPLLIHPHTLGHKPQIQKITTSLLDASAWHIFSDGTGKKQGQCLPGVGAHAQANPASRQSIWQWTNAVTSSPSLDKLALWNS